jgi:hypothetical protein
MSTEREDLGVRWYVIRAGKGHYMMKVPFQDVGGFMEILGDLVEGCGDSREEALSDWANAKLPPARKRWFENLW